MHPDIKSFNESQEDCDREICELLASLIDEHLPEAESKIWHRHPVWFLAGNPIVGYSKLKDCVRLMFWSGQSFATPGLAPTGTFKAGELRLTDVAQVDEGQLAALLAEARDVQWDYKNIVKRKGKLIRL